MVYYSQYIYIYKYQHIFPVSRQQWPFKRGINLNREKEFFSSSLIFRRIKAHKTHNKHRFSPVQLLTSLAKRRRFVPQFPSQLSSVLQLCWHQDEECTKPLDAWQALSLFLRKKHEKVKQILANKSFVTNHFDRLS